jgi:hypothetical protein
MDFYHASIILLEKNHFKTCDNHIFTNNIESNKINSHILRSGLTTILMLSDLYIHDKNTKKKYTKPDKIDTTHLGLQIKTENWYSCLAIIMLIQQLIFFNFKISEFFNYSSFSDTNYRPKKLSVKLRIRPFDTHFKQYYISSSNILN